MIPQITIMTSIFTSRVEQQQKAVRSWLELGFNVVSVNLAEEADEVKSLFPDITLIPIDRPQNHKIGSRIYLHEIFTAINTLQGSVFGIVNSDIVFATGADFPDFINKHTADSMVFGSRIDIDVNQFEFGKEYPFGFDYFFFKKNLLKVYTDINFCLGMPLWDYWLPLSAAVSGFSLKRLLSPVALHVKHEEVWAEKNNDDYWPIMEKSVKDWLNKRGKEDSAVWRLLPFLNSSWRTGAGLIQHYLKYETTSIFQSSPTEIPGLINIHGSTFSGVKNDILLQINRYKELEQSLLAIKHSRSWRITELLRTFASFYRSIFSSHNKG